MVQTIQQTTEIPQLRFYFRCIKLPEIAEVAVLSGRRHFLHGAEAFDAPTGAARRTTEFPPVVRVTSNGGRMFRCLLFVQILRHLLSRVKTVEIPTVLLGPQSYPCQWRRFRLPWSVFPEILQSCSFSWQWHVQDW